MVSARAYFDNGRTGSVSHINLECQIDSFGHKAGSVISGAGDRQTRSPRAMQGGRTSAWSAEKKGLIQLFDSAF